MTVSHCRPSILSLNTYILSYGCHTHLSFSYGTVRAPFNLSRFPSLKWACMWSIECICSSFRVSSWRFCFYWHHAIGRKWAPPEVLAQSKFIGVCQIQSTWDCFNCISLVQTRNCAPFIFLDSLFTKEVSVKNS